MRRILIATVLAAGLLLAPNVFAADWAFTIDTPLSYTFNDSNATKSVQTTGPATWHNRTTTDVSGSQALLIFPFHVGIGYEDYSVAEKADYQTGGGGTGVANVKTNFRIIDAVVDIPMKYLNLTLGYGQGTADIDIISIGQNTNPTPIRGANVTQYFLMAGIPLGVVADLHLGYHWLTVQEKDLISGGPTPYDQLLVSGQMLSAGLRVNF